MTRAFQESALVRERMGRVCRSQLTHGGRLTHKSRRVQGGSKGYRAESRGGSTDPSAHPTARVHRQLTPGHPLIIPSNHHPPIILQSNHPPSARTPATPTRTRCSPHC